MQKLYHCTCCEKLETEERLFSSKSYEENKKKYGDNKVVNSKYTIFSFLPLILITHLSRFMNLYFIIIGILELFKYISPVNPLTTWVPIIVIFAITFVREGIDDYHHHLQDNEINSRRYKVIRNGVLKKIKSKDITVGDIVIVKRDHECPCDLALLSSTDELGVAYIETSNLDGETNLKEIRSIRQFQELGLEGFKNNTIYIRCRPPTSDLYSFVGTGFINSLDSDCYQMDRSQLIQAGVFIKSVDHIIGIACYTGNKTKLGLNSNPPPVKWTQIERFIDKCSIIIFIAQIILAIIYGSIANWQKGEMKDSNPYLRLDVKKATQPIILYARCYLLTSVMIPISLKVTLDVCKYIYATWIRNDFEMYKSNTKTRAKVNNTSVIEDLGAIEYLFTDKTGTLTENEMILQKMCIDSKFFGYENCDNIYKDPTLISTLMRCDPSEVEITTLRTANFRTKSQFKINLNVMSTKATIPKVTVQSNKKASKNNNNNNNNNNDDDDDDNDNDNNDNNNNNNKVSEFNLEAQQARAEAEQKKKEQTRKNLLLLIYNICLCHSIKVTYDENNKKLFEGISADEVSFLQGMDCLGIDVKTDYNINNRAMTIYIKSASLKIDAKFEVLEIFQFSYNRRLMSVIVRDISDKQLDEQGNKKENENKGKLYMFTKGAHESVSGLCDRKYDSFDEQVDSLSYLGLRVMAFSYKEIDEDTLQSYRDRIVEISRSRTLEQREETIEDLNKSYEDNQILLGCTGIEDRLQDNVARTVKMLRLAGIKIWMVTGDVQGTALKIARTTNLVSAESILIDITKKDTEKSAEEILDAIQEYIDENDGRRPFSLLINGDSDKTDEYLFNYTEKFASIASKAFSVICCRTTPKRKAQYVELIQSLKKITMSVGDGGNDVFMIRSAHIGVGIMGKEGRQAASASDFAISNFGSLQRLILIHGRFSFYRTSWLTQFCFYKSIMLSLVQVLSMFWNGYSGASVFNDFNLMCYNAIFTLLPVIFFLFDKDVEDETVFVNPYLYSDTRLRVFCNARTMFWWIMRAIFQAVVVTLVSNYSLGLDAINGYDGNSVGLDEYQQIVYSSLILNVLFTVVFDTQQFTSLNFIFIWGNWLLYILFTIFANLIPDFTLVRKNYLVCWRVYSNPYYWIVVLTTTNLCIMPIVAIQALFSTVLPTNSQLLRYFEVTKQSQDNYIVSNIVDAKDGPSQYLHLRTEDDLTVWEKSHNLCIPLGKLCTTCRFQSCKTIGKNKKNKK